MKVYIINLLLFCSVVLYSQPISVNNSLYTVPQLVNNILINSPCVSAQNITWRTGFNFGSSNGIGYFQNTNSNFPIQNGVILSTGDVLNAAGPNTSTLNDGSNFWVGDSDLEVVLALAGVNLNSKNATVLEFEFVPLSPYFDLDFLYASEDYGNFQCQNSDAFALILINMTTGISTNLAVVPNSNIPISVNTIRDILYNSSCGSSNPQYFGRYNGAGNASSSAINFNGQTKVLRASSTLTPNNIYKLKIVIADRSDSSSDSALFLPAGSLNIGQDVLGPDVTIANGTAFCSGSTQTLTTGLNPNDYSFIWKKDNVTISGATGNSLTITESGVYELVYTFTPFPCQTVTDTKIVEFIPLVNPPNGNQNQSVAPGSTIANLIVSGSNIVWYASASNALQNINPLPTGTLLVNNATYYAMQTVNNCRSVSPLSVTVTLTLNTIESNKSLFSLYPNPAINTVSLDTDENIKKIEIYTIHGQLMLFSSTKIIDVSSLPSNIYFIKIENVDGLFETKKLIIKK